MDFLEDILFVIIKILWSVVKGIFEFFKEMFEVINNFCDWVRYVIITAFVVLGCVIYFSMSNNIENKEVNVHVDIDITDFGINCEKIIADFKADPLIYRQEVQNHIRKRFMMITPEQEKAIGEYVLKVLKERNIFLNNKKQQKRCDKILAKLKTVLPPDFAVQDQIYIIDSPTVNAFCYIGGKVFVYRGLLETVKDNDVLAFVIAHELGHAVARHGAEKLSKSILFSIPVDFILDEKDEPLWKILGTKITLDLVSFKYSRSMEFEADRLAVLFVKRAGFDAKKAIDFFGAFDQKEMKYWQELLSTHPADNKRIKEIEETTSEIQTNPKEPQWGGWKAKALEKSKVAAIKTYLTAQKLTQNEDEESKGE